MILPLATRLDGARRREAARYAAWSEALARLRAGARAGNLPAPDRLREYVHDLPEDQRGDALLDLVAEHLRWTWEAGDGVTLEAYGSVLAGCALPSVFGDVPADLVEDELLARSRPPHGDLPGPEEYARRYPGREDVRVRLAARFLGDGRWVRLSRLGAGAMGEVWEACDRRAQRRVAVKLARPERAADPEILVRFRREVEVTVGLDHPGIACAREVGIGDGGLPFCAMPLAEGRPLAALAAQLHGGLLAASAADRRRLERRALAAFVSACAAVAHAHARRVTHGDLKPGNIIVDERGAAVVIDWALSECVGRPTGAWLAGTPEYMAPEQVDGMRDARSDVFGLGAVLFELLTGRPPHCWRDGVRPTDWRAIVRAADLPSVRRVAPGAPSALDALCRRALTRDPAERPPDAGALAEEVVAYLAGGESWTAGVTRWLAGLRQAGKR